MTIGTPYKPRVAPVESLLPKVVYMHYLDNTEGIPGNRPWVVYTTNKKNPFGRRGKDYSPEFAWGYKRLVWAGE